jgi:PAS domain S-box-containing protein
MKPFTPSIRTILLLTIGTLTVVVASLAGLQLMGDARRLRDIGHMSEMSALSDQIAAAAETTALMRDVGLSMLAAPGPTTRAELQPRFLEARGQSDAAWRTVISALDRRGERSFSAMRRRLAVDRDAVLELRPLIDSAMMRPVTKRDPALTALWRGRIAVLLESTQALWNVAAALHADIDPIVTLHLRYKNSLRAIRDHAGEERALVGQVIARRTPPTSDEIAAFLRDQGATDEDWRFNRSAAEQSGLYAKVAPAYSDAVSQYATLRDMLKDSYFVPGRATGLPISADLWFELSTQAAESLDTLSRQSKQTAQDYLDQLVAQTKDRMAIHALFASLALLLCLSCLWVVIIRVIRPINQIIQALQQTMRGEQASFAVSEGRRDEIGKLNHVMQSFRRTWEEAHRTAAELARSEAYQRAVVDHARDGLMTIDSSGVVRRSNDACARILGYAKGEIDGLPVHRLIPTLNPLDFEDGCVVQSVESVAHNRDGAQLPIELSVSVFVVGESTHLSAILRDITARKAAEQALLAHTHALERSNKELDDFAYIASHDLKEPLRGMHNHARFLLEDNEAKLDAESAKRLHRLVYLSQRMEKLVNDLLYFSRLGRQELAYQATDLNAVIRDVEGTIEHFLLERGAHIQMPAPLPTIICDKPRVAEVFRNLITNAVKYNDRTEKLIEIGALPSMRTPDGRVVHDVFYVRDNGIGIDVEFHQEIFRIFRRLQADQEGTGVGLTFVKKIIERHGGDIWIDSRRGEGATFFFTLQGTSHDAEFGARAA